MRVDQLCFMSLLLWCLVSVVECLVCVFSTFDWNFNDSFNNSGQEKSAEVEIVLPGLQELTMIRAE